MGYTSHHTAIVDNGATIGERTKIWHWTHISGGAIIGSNCVLGQNIFVGNNAVVGNNVKIQNNVSVFDNVIIKDKVFCGPSVVFTNVYNPRSEINRKSEYKYTIINEGATLGANSTLVCGISIGKYAFVGAGSVVNRDVPDFSLVVGVPARQIGWVSVYGEQLNIPLSGNAEVVCKKSNQRYILDGSTLSSREI
jgi:UDP-2-acetamido-3-amino-2,3-dideoxy-glucuronate N-acetyltransferase